MFEGIDLLGEGWILLAEQLRTKVYVSTLSLLVLRNVFHNQDP